jgi:hypothetical protein
LTGGRQQFLYISIQTKRPIKTLGVNNAGSMPSWQITGQFRWLGLQALPDLPGRLAVIPEPEVDESARPF